MRPTRRPQNALRAPLNAILGTEANVRLLRVLARTEMAMTAGELAQRARLGRTSVYPALRGLESAGIVDFVGVGAHKQLRLRAEHPLAHALVQLFSAEAERVTALLSALRESFAALSRHPSAAWLEGLNDEQGDEEHLTVWIVADPKTLPQMTDAVAERIGNVEHRFGVQVAVSGLTRSEIERRAKAEPERLVHAIPLDGIPPTTFMPRTDGHASVRRLHSHAEHDIRARRLAVAVAAKLMRDPSLVRRARARVARRATHASPGERRELREWLRILDTTPTGAFERILTDRSERGTRLRQTLPALAVLTPLEREAVLASETDEEARAAVMRPRRR